MEMWILFLNNKDLFIESNDLPKDDCVKKWIIEPQTKKEETKEEDDISLIFCLDNSGNMKDSYIIDKRFNKIRTKQFSNKITKLEMVKFAVEKIINSTVKDSPKVKFGFVTFSTDIEVKRDCLSNRIKIFEKDFDNESKLISLGKENADLIKAEISKSFDNIIKYLRSID